MRNGILRMAGLAAGLLAGVWAAMPGAVYAAGVKVPALEEKRRDEEMDGAPVDDIKMKMDFEGAPMLKVGRMSNTHFAVDLEDKFVNWFIFRVDGAKGKTIRIDLKNVPLDKWATLNPVYSEVKSLEDPAEFVSTLPEVEKTRGAFNGPLIPETTGQKWHYCENVWADRGTKSLNVVQKFEGDSVYIAMRVPYLPKLAEAMLEGMKDKRGVKIYDIGKSDKNRALHVIRIGDGEEEGEKSKPCILMYGREHASDQDSSWAIQGAMEFLVMDTEEARKIRGSCTVLLIPLLDPDTAAAGLYEGITDDFVSKQNNSQSAQAYAAFFRKWMKDGKRLDLTFNLQNVESGESPHIVSPEMYPTGERRAQSEILMGKIAKEGKEFGLEVSTKPWNYSMHIFRLGGYLERYYGPLHFPLMLNSQDRKKHLQVFQIKDMGAMLAYTAGLYLNSTEAEPLMEEVVSVRGKWKARMEKYEQAASDGGRAGALQIESRAMARESVEER